MDYDPDNGAFGECTVAKGDIGRQRKLYFQARSLIIIQYKNEWQSMKTRFIAATIAAAILVLPMGAQISTVHAGVTPITNPQPEPQGAQGWLAVPVSTSEMQAAMAQLSAETLPATSAQAIPQWALELAKTSVSENSTSLTFNQDVAEMAVRLYDHCLSAGARCHAPTLATVWGGQVASGTQKQTILPLTTYSVQPGTPYYGTAASATYEIGNQTVAGPNDNSTAMIEPYNNPPNYYYNYCGPGSNRVAASSWTEFYSKTPASFAWEAAKITGFNENNGGTQWNVDLLPALNGDIQSKTGLTNRYGVSAATDGVITVMQSHLGNDLSNYTEPMIIAGDTAWLPSWPTTTSVAHNVALYQYDFTNGRSNISYDDTANATYDGNLRDGQIATDINHIWHAMTTSVPLSGGNSVDKDVW